MIVPRPDPTPIPIPVPLPDPAPLPEPPVPVPPPDPAPLRGWDTWLGAVPAGIGSPLAVHRQECPDERARSRAAASASPVARPVA